MKLKKKPSAMNLWTPKQKGAGQEAGQAASTLFIGSFFALTVACLLFSPEAFAVKDGEMKTGVTYLTGLLDNNIIPLVLLTGTGAGAAVSYMKSSFTPLVIAICTAGGYGFAHKWISSVYTFCI